MTEQSEQGADRVDPHLAAWIRGQVEQGAMPQDIGQARLDPALSTYIRVAGFHVPDDLAQLAGPEHGVLAVPEKFADIPGEQVDVGDFAARARLYRRVLNLGTDEEQRALLNAELLARTWTADLADRVVMGVWERRFPRLRPAV